MFIFNINKNEEKRMFLITTLLLDILIIKQFLNNEKE